MWKYVPRLALAAACLSISIGSGAAPVLAYAGQQLATQAKVTMAQARAIAVKARPGKITDAELEKERGGSGLRYSFDVNSDGTSYEVGVDAQSGNVLENQVEGSNPD